MDALSCLAPPAALGVLPATSAFADAAIARALHFSSAISSCAATTESASSSSSTASFSAPLLLADLQLQAAAYAPQHHLAAAACDSVLVAHADSPPRRRSPAPSGARKQQLAPAAGRAGKRRSRASKRAPTTYITTDPANFRVMVQHITGAEADSDAPTFDAAAVLLAADSGLPAVGDEASSALLLHQQQQPCFPTLDSWNVVMYQRTNDHLI